MECLDRGPLSVEFAEEVLRGIMDDPAKFLTIDLIQKKVAKYYNVKISEMNSKTRARNLAHPRQIAMYLCRELIGCSYPEIGKKFGGKDHAPVIYAFKKIAQERESSPKLRKTLETLEQQIRS